MGTAPYQRLSARAEAGRSSVKLPDWPGARVTGTAALAISVPLGLLVPLAQASTSPRVTRDWRDFTTRTVGLDDREAESGATICPLTVAVSVPA